MKYKEEMWFPNLGTGETYGVHCLLGVLLIAAGYDAFRVTQEPVIALIFALLGFLLAGMGLWKEIKRRSKAVKRAAAFQTGAKKTVGRIISADGGVRKYSFRKREAGSVNSHGYVMAFEWNAEVEFEREDGEIIHMPVRGLNKNPQKYLRKEVTVYYSGNAVYVKF